MKPADPKFLSSIPQTVWRAWLARLVMGAIFAAAIAIVYYSFYHRLLPVSRQYAQRTTELSRAAEEVEQLQLRSEPKEEAAIRDRFTKAKQMLFGKPEDLRRWEREVRRAAYSVILDPQLEMGTNQSYPGLEGLLAFVPAKLTLQPISILGVTNSPYKRLLDFDQALASSPKKMQLVELTVEAGSNSIKQAKAVVRLLAAEEKAP